MKDLITIIINVFNADKYISKCIESVIKQTYKNIEILIINDGSTDNTLKICNGYKKKDKRIRIISHDNMGLGLSRNVGIDQARGKYIYFVDADDYIEKDTINYLYKLITKYNKMIATCESIKIYNYNTKIINSKEIVKDVDSKTMIRNVLLSIGKHGCVWNKLINKKVFENNQNRFPSGKINDVLQVYKMFYSIDGVIYSNQIKYYYYIHKDSILGTRKKEYSIQMYKACLSRYAEIKGYYDDFIENDVSLLLMIIDIYIHDYEDIKTYYKDHNVYEKYKKVFKISLLKCNMRINHKIKIVLFRINPILLLIITKIYIKIKNMFINK